MCDGYFGYASSYGSHQGRVNVFVWILLACMCLKNSKEAAMGLWQIFMSIVLWWLLPKGGVSVECTLCICFIIFHSWIHGWFSFTEKYMYLPKCFNSHPKLSEPQFASYTTNFWQFCSIYNLIIRIVPCNLISSSSLVRSKPLLRKKVIVWRGKYTVVTVFGAHLKNLW